MASSSPTKQSFEVESNNMSVPKPKGVFLSVPILVVTGIAISLVFTGAILATYFGKQCDDCSGDTCGTLYCERPNIFLEWSAKCPTTTLAPTTTTSPAKVSFRLPNHLKPTMYDFTIKPYIGRNAAWAEAKDFTFEGSINMHFTCVQATRDIIFHAADMKIDANSLVIQSTTDPSMSVPKSYDYEELREFVTVKMSKDCVQGASYVLSMTYEGQILKPLYGFYRSSYIDTATGNQVFLGTTQFQPTDARRAFPCWDEPGLKAKFKFTLIRHRSFPSVYFNTPLEQSVSDATGEWFTDSFETTVDMSTYLVAFVVSDFKTIETTSTKNVKIQVAAKPSSIDAGEGDFALAEAARYIDFFADYFDLDYPLEKSTQIAIPDFAAGAMENWGLVTYREQDLLFNENRDTISNKRRVSLVISHELAHQWFGNLVTLNWWNDLWLNEGFASWVEYLGLDFAHPEWRDLDFFTVQTLDAFELDSLESSHPINVDVNDPAEISYIFDLISYDKGASVIRMMNAFLTEATFRKGVSNYLKQYAYLSVVQDNLWQSLTEQAHIDGTLDRSVTAKQIMDTWTLQQGYPLVTISRNGNQLRLTQKWFLLNPENTLQGTAEYDKYRWYIAFTYTTRQELNWDMETKPTWFTPQAQELLVNLPAGTTADSWYIGNLKRSGWYRINYDTENWNRLVAQLNQNHLLIDPIHRAQLLDDSFNLGRAEVLPQTRFLDITVYLVKEDDPIPFIPAFAGFRYMTVLVEDDPETYDLYKKYYMSLLVPTYNRIAWNVNLEDANEISLQTNVMSTMCTFGNQDCITRARQYYDDWLDDGTPIPVNFRNIVYQTSMKYGTEADWRNLLNIATNTVDNPEKLRMIRGLAATNDYFLLKTLLYKTLDTNFIRPQDTVSIVSAIAGNPIGRRMAYDFMEEKWDEFVARYGLASSTLASLATACTYRLNKQFDLIRVESFVARNPDNLGTASDAFDKSIETIGTNIRWTRVNLQSIYQWLQTNGLVIIKKFPIQNIV